MSSTSKLLTPQWRILPSRLSAVERLERFVERHAAAPVEQSTDRAGRSSTGAGSPRRRQSCRAWWRSAAAPCSQGRSRRGDRQALRRRALRLRHFRTFPPYRPPSSRGRRPSAAPQSRRRAFCRLSPMFQVPIPSAGIVSPSGSAIVRMPAIFLYNPPYEDSRPDCGLFREPGGHDHRLASADRVLRRARPERLWSACTVR